MVLPFAGKMGLVLEMRILLLLESSAGRQLCKSTHRKELKANVCSRQQYILLSPTYIQPPLATQYRSEMECSNE